MYQRTWLGGSVSATATALFSGLAPGASLKTGTTQTRNNCPGAPLEYNAPPAQKARSSSVALQPSQSTSATVGMRRETLASGSDGVSTVVRGQARKIDAEARRPNRVLVHEQRAAHHNCHIDAPMYVASKAGTSEAFLQRSTACRATSLSKARCKASTSKWRLRSRLLTIQSTVHMRGPMPHSQIRQGSSSRCSRRFFLGCWGEALSRLAEHLSTASANWDNSVQRSTSDTPSGF
mmetsp:Transcript_16713/g.47391  ORF Transcript_16713/g.47391 Transcript_16713/m.47391 type:complete len:235 (+) Transcript_16713:44-748(+)